MSSHRYLAVRNFRRFQHYRDRNPVWIKLYTGLLLDPDFLQLHEVAQAQLVKLWVVRAQFGKPLPYDVKLLSGKIAARGKFHLQALIDSGFIVPTDHPDAVEDAAEDTPDSASNPASKDASNPASTEPGSEASGSVRAPARSRESESRELETELSLPPARVRLCAAANRGLEEHPTHSQKEPRVLPNSGSTSQAMEAIVRHGVPIEFAESAIYEIAKNHSADGQITSLKYFVAGVKRRWDQRNASSDARSSRPRKLPDSGETRNGMPIGEWRRREGLIMARKARSTDGDLWWARMEREAAAAGVKNVWVYAWDHLDEDDTPARSSRATA
jgi:hypothetical protein